MIIGVPKEIKNNENRVGMIPAGAYAMIAAGHKVLVETGAGANIGFSDDDYKKVGATIIANAAEVWQQAEMIVKVKEPLESEYGYFRNGLILFTYLHLSGVDPVLTQKLMEHNVIAIAYETVQIGKTLPLLTPMSEVAGRMAIQVGAHYLEKVHGGKGLLLSGVPGVRRGNVVVIGAGISGTNAAKIAAGQGADVTIIDINANRLREIDDTFGQRIKTLMSNPYNIAEAVKNADLVIGAVLIPGAKAPKLVTREMVKTMQSGSVIVDIAIDQGGCIETIDRVTTHADPVYVCEGVTHYAVANMPGAVAQTSTIALTNVTLPYALEIANKGAARAIAENDALKMGVNVAGGKVTYKAIADDLGHPYHPLDTVTL